MQGGCHLSTLAYRPLQRIEAGQILDKLLCLFQPGFSMATGSKLNAYFSPFPRWRQCSQAHATQAKSLMLRKGRYDDDGGDWLSGEAVSVKFLKTWATSSVAGQRVLLAAKDALAVGLSCFFAPHMHGAVDEYPCYAPLGA